MKKLLAVLLSMLMVAAITACGSTGKDETKANNETSETTETTESINESETSAGIANPWGDYDTLEEAEEAAGFTYSFRDVIGCGVYYAKAFRAMDGMMDVTYYPEGSTEESDQYVIRQANKTDEDISGDYESYSHDFTIDDCGIEDIRLRGTKDSLAVCSFNYGDFSYVIYPGPMDYTETFVVIGELTGIDSTEYTYDTDQTEAEESKTYTINDFVGDWDCEDNYLESEDSDSYTGFYALSVTKKGEFSIYDAEAGNPGIEGKMKVKSNSEVTVTCKDEDFDPPAEWMNMSEKQTLQYEFVGEDELHLIYTENGTTSTLVFHRE